MSSNWNNGKSLGSLAKPPMLAREEYPQWKIRITNFLKEVDNSLLECIAKGPHCPTVDIPKIKETEISASVPARTILKERKWWSEENKTKEVNEDIAKTVLIMTLPHDIFCQVDCNTSAKGIWDALEKLFDGGGGSNEKKQKNKSSK
ncbi:hypothetical protein SSX86_029882 [Deinandra increscens subsp. villosa]|uniref:Gag-pol polyprotein n=1 Tax=Deinandra increscens subsp. villosa TaxID=3103831 RepID=A0AAP0GM82_9ASTR